MHRIALVPSSNIQFCTHILCVCLCFAENMLFHFKHLTVLFWIVFLYQQVRKTIYAIHSSHLLGQLGNQQNMEVLEKVEDLVDVFVLHLSTSDALPALAVFVREHNLRHTHPVCTPD